MSALESTTDQYEPSHLRFRLITLLFAVLLSAQSIWLVAAELSRSDIDELPTNANSADAAAAQRDAATRAAEIGVIRGDLWAQSAFTFASLVTDPKSASANSDLSSLLSRVQTSLGRGLHDAPAQSGAWLLRAALGYRYAGTRIDATEALKMSYYTGPSDINLIPMRLRLAMLTNDLHDVELNQFVTRDLRLLLVRKQNSAVTEIYKDASPTARHLIEQIVGDFDPSALDALRTSGAQQ
ncbi:MAG TPA: hypothetical protein VIY68_04410 [Steroidobacteraceae bacterium]